MHGKNRFRLPFSTSAALWLCASGAAVAQSAPEPASAGAKASGTNVVGEVIVTTQRRAERLRDVPISVVAKTGDQLAQSGVSNLEDIAVVVPAVKIDQIGNYLQPAIRGVSSTLSGPGTEQPVAIYVDGFIQPDPLASYTEFVDLDRVEVTKGPQGTLFGRNATGGAISMYTKAPSFTPTGQFLIGYGKLRRFRREGVHLGTHRRQCLGGESLGILRNTSRLRL